MINSVSLFIKRLKRKIGAELAVIITNQLELAQAIAENPFGEDYDSSRIHLVFTNNKINREKLNELLHQDFLVMRSCVREVNAYTYLPRDAQKKTKY